MKKNRGGPVISPNEIRLKAELDKVRRELARHKKAAEAGEANEEPKLSSRVELPERPSHENDDAVVALIQKIDELENTKKRLSKLYFGQLDENKKRAERLNLILRIINDINSDLDLDRLMNRVASTIRESLGFRIVLIRVREPGTDRLRARAFAGLSSDAQDELTKTDLTVEGFQSWLKDEFRVGRSYFISHKHEFNRELPEGHVADLGDRQEWEWHERDVMLVPLVSGTGELVGYFSVDDPVDRLVPSTEKIELLEIFGNHVVVAIENARLYRQLESNNHDLESAGQRIQEMGALKARFMSTISHELRTPLTAILACVEALTMADQRGGTLAPGQLHRFLSIVNEESRRLTRLIESVLDLNRMDSGQLHARRQRIELVETLDEAVRVLESAALAGKVNLKVVNDLTDTGLDADRDQIRQLLLHLGSNAVKFTPQGGTVTFHLGGDDREVTMRVEDSGIGIPAEALERIFERFYQVDSSLVRRYGGTGLGLSICRAIVDWHDGRISASSTLGQGSCFTVILPRHGVRSALDHPGMVAKAGTGDVPKAAVEMVAEVMNARVVSVMSCEPEGDLVIQAALGLEERIVREARQEVGRSVAGWVAQHRRGLYVTNDSDLTEVQRTRRDQYHCGAFLSVPLQCGDQLLGVLNVADPVVGTFTTDDSVLLVELADRAASLWDYARRNVAAPERAVGATETLRQLVAQFARAKVGASGGARLAEAVARELNCSASEIAVVHLAAAARDFGMTLLGGHLLAGFDSDTNGQPGRDLPAAVRDALLARHEWWDGSGYPRRLREAQIPLGARILAVVDAFERLTLGHREGASPSRAEVLADLGHLAGRRFDPEVVAAFGRALAHEVDAHPTEHTAHEVPAVVPARR